MCHMGKTYYICAIAAFFFRCVRDGAEESLPTHVSNGEIRSICAIAAFFFRCVRDGAEESLPTHVSNGEIRSICAIAAFFLDVSETELKKPTDACVKWRNSLNLRHCRVFFRCVRDGAEESLPTHVSNGEIRSISAIAAFFFRCVRDGAEESLPTPGAGLPSGQEQGARGSRGI
jgi:hypothetical protein